MAKQTEIKASVDIYLKTEKLGCLEAPLRKLDLTSRKSFKGRFESLPVGDVYYFHPSIYDKNILQ